MKFTGIVRKVDALGRIVLPIELRRILQIEENDSIEIHVDGDTVMLKKHSENCYFCQSKKDVTVFKDKPICKSCLLEICELNK